MKLVNFVLKIAEFMVKLGNKCQTQDFFSFEYNII